MNRDFDEKSEDIEYESTHKKSLITVKTHMKELGVMIDGIRKDLNQNKIDARRLRGDNQTLEHKTTEKRNELMKLISEDINNFQKDLKRVKQNDSSETAFFEQQLKMLNDDKLKIAMSVMQLDKRLKTCEAEVGMGYL
jgi:hypothetical protein